MVVIKCHDHHNAGLGDHDDHDGDFGDIDDHNVGLGDHDDLRSVEVGWH